MHFAVCQVATGANAAATTRQTGGKADEIYQELVSNLVGNATLKELLATQVQMMTMRYAHPTPEDKRRAIEKFEADLLRDKPLGRWSDLSAS